MWFMKLKFKYYIKFYHMVTKVISSQKFIVITHKGPIGLLSYVLEKFPPAWPNNWRIHSASLYQLQYCFYVSTIGSMIKFHESPGFVQLCQASLKFSLRMANIKNEEWRYEWRKQFFLEKKGMGFDGMSLMA